MANVLGLKDTQANVICGLGTFTYTALATAVYKFSIQSTVSPPSGLSIVINQNGSPIDTTNSPSINSTHIELSIIQPCALNDVITFVLTSSAFNDMQPGGVNSTISIIVENANV
jgi:hypothetical protein